MSTDRELLEMAAKAAGIELNGSHDWRGVGLRRGPHNYWNPLAHDDEALRLVTRLRMVADASARANEVRYWIGTEECPRGVLGEDDTDEDMRRCIVRAAAAIGREAT